MSVVLLVAAVAASGSQAQTGAMSIRQKPIAAPQLPGATRKGGFVLRVACASAKSCAAVGKWLYSDLAGKWKAARMPSITQTGDTILLSLACPAAGKCEAVGIAGLQHAVLASESGRHWRIGEADLPSDAAALDSETGPEPSLVSVSCGSADNCVAVGRYLASDSMWRP